MTAVQSAPADTGQPDRTRRWADIITRYVYSSGIHGPENAAIRLQAEDDVREALAAVDLVQRLRADHVWVGREGSTWRSCSCGTAGCKLPDALGLG